MNNDLTGQVDHNKDEIRIGDLVVLIIPRKERRENAVIFEVVKDEDTYSIIYSEKYSHNTISVGSPHYKQLLNHQVYQIVGNVTKGVDESLFK